MSSPEVNLARRLVERRSLRPPIDVHSLARAYATVEEIEVPIDVDGICLNLKRPGYTPFIIVNSSRGRKRIRFTIAHELGHVIIPWHMGSIVDEIDFGAHGFSDYWIKEGEANRFASELLMPWRWVDQCLGRHENPHGAVRSIAEEADVSIQAAALRVVNVSSIACVFAAVEDGRVQLSGRSATALANHPRAGDEIDPLSLFPWTDHHWEKAEGSTVYHWWVFKGVSSTPVRQEDHWRDLLTDITAELRIPVHERKKFTSSLNGTIAYANRRIRENRSPSTIFEACLQRIHSIARTDARMLYFTRSTKFERFLWARVYELCERAA